MNDLCSKYIYLGPMFYIFMQLISLLVKILTIVCDGVIAFELFIYVMTLKTFEQLFVMFAVILAQYAVIESPARHVYLLLSLYTIAFENFLHFL